MVLHGRYASHPSMGQFVQYPIQGETLDPFSLDPATMRARAITFDQYSYSISVFILISISSGGLQTNFRPLLSRSIQSSLRPLLYPQFRMSIVRSVVLFFYLLSIYYPFHDVYIFIIIDSVAVIEQERCQDHST